MAKYSLLSLLFLVFACSDSEIKPTYSEDIAPIIYKSCTPCHRSNQVGQFSLTTFHEVKSRANQIKFTVANRLMPPWPADPHYTEFKGQLTLSDEEINKIVAWVDAACPVGDSNHIPPVPNYPSRSFLGKPDLTISVKPSYIPAKTSDQFLLVKVPFEVPTDTFIRAVEFIPGNTKVVHHVNGDMVKFDPKKKKNVFDGEWLTNMVLDSSIRLAYKKLGVLHDDGSYPILAKSVVNYLPGVIAQEYPDGIGGWYIHKKNAFLLNDLHYGSTEESVWDSSYINVFFASAPPKRPIQEFQMGTLGVSQIVPPLIIQPNTISKHTTTLTINESISILTINPHMHLLGKSFKAYALKPNGDTIRLIHIPKWNFNWQYFYTFKKMLVIPKGSTIIVEGEFDNTTENPFNPFNPPRVVRDNNGSMKTSDEMFQFIVSYLPYKEGDEHISLERK